MARVYKSLGQHIREEQKYERMKKGLIDYYKELRNQKKIVTVEEIMDEFGIKERALDIFYKEYNLTFREQGMLPIEMTILFYTKFKKKKYISERNKLIEYINRRSRKRNEIYSLLKPHIDAQREKEQLLLARERLLEVLGQVEKVKSK